MVEAVLPPPPATAQPECPLRKNPPAEEPPLAGAIARIARLLAMPPLPHSAMLPAAMLEITRLFTGVTEDQRRELLLSLAASAPRWQPAPDEKFDFSEVRKDAICSDAAGIHLRRRGDGRLTLRISLGPEVQTLTRAMATVLCQGLEGSTAGEIAVVPESLATEIAGTELVRLRSRSVYYLLRRVKEAAELLSCGCG